MDQFMNVVRGCGLVLYRHVITSVLLFLLASCKCPDYVKHRERFVYMPDMDSSSGCRQSPSQQP